MEEKKIQKFRQRLLEEYQKLIRSINRNRLAEEEIKLENTEDEGDLATISHNKELLYNLHESDFQRLKSIQEALKRMDRGEYGECVRCGEDINEKRLMAVPWATLCIQCQEEAEREGTSQRPVMAGMLKTEESEDEPEERCRRLDGAPAHDAPRRDLRDDGLSRAGQLARPRLPALPHRDGRHRRTRGDGGAVARPADPGGRE